MAKCNSIVSFTVIKNIQTQSRIGLDSVVRSDMRQRFEPVALIVPYSAIPTELSEIPWR